MKYMTFIVCAILFIIGVTGGAVIGYKLTAYSSRNLYYAAKMNELINQQDKEKESWLGLFLFLFAQ